MRSPFPIPLLVLVCASGSLAPAAEITGRVLSERRGVVGAAVSAVPYESSYARALRETTGAPEPQPVTSVVTAGDGRFKLLAPQTAPPFVVRVTFGSLAGKTLDGVFEKSDVEDVGEVTLGRGETISGRVVDESGKAIAGARVRVGRDGISKTT